MTLSEKLPDRLRVPFGDKARLIALAVLTAGCMAVFLTIDARANWAFVLERRGLVVATMVLVGYAIALSTVLFQTVTNNQILTPSIMGFDALFILIQTIAAFFIGVSAMASFDSKLRFVLEIALMVAFSMALYRWLLVGMNRSVHLLVLVGIVFGVFFRSLSSFMQRLMDPTQFVVLQDRFFATFTAVDEQLLMASYLIVGVISVLAWRMLNTLDVMALGRENAINLGVDHRQVTMRVLILVSLLVAVATALVGPTTFFGLLVAHVAYQVMRSHRHRVTVPAAALIAVIALVGGQVLLERLFDFDTSLSIIIEFLGGIVFIVLLLRKAGP